MTGRAPEEGERGNFARESQVRVEPESKAFAIKAHLFSLYNNTLLFAGKEKVRLKNPHTTGWEMENKDKRNSELYKESLVICFRSKGIPNVSQKLVSTVTPNNGGGGNIRKRRPFIRTMNNLTI